MEFWKVQLYTQVLNKHYTAIGKVLILIMFWSPGQRIYMYKYNCSADYQYHHKAVNCLKQQKYYQLM